MSKSRLENRTATCPLCEGDNCCGLVTSGAHPKSPEGFTPSASSHLAVASADQEKSMSVEGAHTIHVCTSCRFREGLAMYGQHISGAHLLDDLLARGRAMPALRVVGQECLSACDRPCAIAFSAPGKATSYSADSTR